MISRGILICSRTVVPRRICPISMTQFIRYQSQKKPPSNFRDIADIKDQKLRDIIEGTNLGQEALKKEQEEKSAKEKDSREDEIRKKNRDIEVKQHRLEKRMAEDEKDESTIELKEIHKAFSEESKAKSEENLSKEDESANLRLGSSDSSRVVQQINEAIQKEIGNLPSQMEKTRSKMSKKLEEYLDSIQGTILTATRALNDVTGYSAIEKLKKSIEKLEAELRECKEQVKECKIAYTDAIQRRSDSQREVNELLTRKHNWSTKDLERFTELYRNDHANERLESEAEQNLEDAEQKVDAVQLKLTQSILTRYHEEQIWSDKIRRSSTWGTWILMGINVMLFMVATFFVEPWKRRKLVRAFEDKVKDLLVTQEETKVIEHLLQPAKDVEEPILQPIEDVVEGVVGSVETTLEIASQEVANLVESPISEEPREAGDSSKSKQFELNFIKSTWNDFKQVVTSNYNALSSPDVTTLQVNKFQFEVFLVSITFVACSIGSLITLYFK
ncbi:SHE9 [[Candida] subhashii]|uniref:Sensitive to high expression protein 9, mitochondrial n=1 Tax=[Candida] subhashii TaxID=561895 RepID=A0A8J5UM34_9ASCO|nr:SHE9 [[Candida] subhashii]KAG7662882.1 SHE9 [[Candida] subhashii]